MGSLLRSLAGGLGLMGWLLALAPVHADETALPMGPEVSAIAAHHFPTTAHAVIWRNWSLVSPPVIAGVLRAKAGEVEEIAEAMGLPARPEISPFWRRQGYITIVRRNWHLLPYGQILPLIDMSADELGFALREDDVLFIKLGSLKPRCPEVRLQERTEEVRAAEARIRRVVAGIAETVGEEPPFHFVEELRAPSGAPGKPLPPDWRNAAPRFIYSYFGVFGDPLADDSLDPYPDGLLERLSAEGANGIWLHVVLRQLAPGGEDFPEFGEGQAKRLESLRKIVRRAEKYGMLVYLYLNEPRAMPEAFYQKRPAMAGVREHGYAALCTSDPKVRKWMGDATAHVFREVPGLGGIVAISASENLTNCASHFRHEDCPRCSQRTPDEIIAEVNGVLEEGVHRSAPQARCFLWDWGWNRHRESPEIISRLPKNSWLLSVSEWAAPFDRGGVKGKVGEYSMSVAGPGPRALAQWKSAREAGLKTAAKVQFNNTWELASVPWLPVGDLIAEHCEALVKQQVGGLMLSWSLGGHPSPNLQIGKQYFDGADGGSPDREKVLLEVSAGRYGNAAAPHVRKAWLRFSEAFREFPYNGSTLYQGPQHMGPANLPYLAPTGYKASMVGFPYDDLAGWRGPYAVDAFATQFEKISGGWNEGIKEMEAAVSASAGSSPEERKRVAEDLVIARAAGIHFRSAGEQTRFVAARDRWLAAAPGSPERAAGKEALDRTLQQLAASARELYPLARADSRIGFEASNHYFYTANDLRETLVAVDWQRSRLAGD